MLFVFEFAKLQKNIIFDKFCPIFFYFCRKTGDKN